VVVYKVDRLTRSLADFAKIVEILDAKGASFVSVTQQFNTTTSMGRLTLNVLLSFAQFEREVTGERIRDKIAASKKKGMWMGGVPPFGYEALPGGDDHPQIRPGPGRRLHDGAEAGDRDTLFGLGVVRTGRARRRAEGCLFLRHRRLQGDRRRDDTSGSGMVANEHEQREINVGDVVHIKAGERHWHGAKANTTMGHITITAVGSQATHG
jgi:hypothetical protein